MAEKNVNTQVSTDAAAGQFLQKFGKSLKDYAVRKYDKDAFLKSAMIAIADNALLSECIKTEVGKRSLFNALRYAASTGLSLNPQEGKAALIGYTDKNKNVVINYQVMKNGMVELALASGKVDFITADLVREKDIFSLQKSAQGDNYNFAPAIRDRGEVIGFVAALKLRGGATYVKWMTVDEVNEIRDAYSSTYKYSKDNSPWTKSFNGMGTKTVMKALLRSVSICQELDNAIGTDDFFEADFSVHGATPEETIEKLKADKKPVGDEKQGDLL